MKPLQMPTTFKCLDEQRRPAQNFIDIESSSDGKKCVTLLFYNVVEPESLRGRFQY